MYIVLDMSYYSLFNMLPGIPHEKFASDLGLGGGFHRLLWFPPPLTTGSYKSQISLKVAEKVIIIKIPNSKSTLKLTVVFEEC